MTDCEGRETTGAVGLPLGNSSSHRDQVPEIFVLLPPHLHFPQNNLMSFYNIFLSSFKWTFKKAVLLYLYNNL